MPSDPETRARELLSSEAARAVWCAAFGAGFAVENLKRQVMGACRAVLQLGMQNDFAAAAPRLEEISDAMWHVMREPNDLDAANNLCAQANNARLEALTELSTAREERDAAVRERDEARELKRLGTQALIAEFGADGPMDLDDAIVRAVRAYRSVAEERDAALSQLGALATLATLAKAIADDVIDRDISISSKRADKLRDAADAALNAKPQGDATRGKAEREWVGGARASVRRNAERQRRLAIPKDQRMPCSECSERGVYNDDEGVEYECPTCGGYGWFEVESAEQQSAEGSVPHG